MPSRPSTLKTRTRSAGLALLFAIAAGRGNTGLGREARMVAVVASALRGGVASWAAVSAWLTWLATLAVEVALDAWPWMRCVQRRPAPVIVLEPSL